MKKQGLIAGSALAGAIFLSSCVFPPSLPEADSAIGNKMTDGTVYAGLSPNTHKPFYTTPTDAPGVYNWSKGGEYCRALQASGHQDWRVPTKDELNVLYKNQHAGVLNGTFNETGPHPAGLYWAVSQNYYYDAWAQRFGDGRQYYGGRHTVSSLRCVRG